MKVIVATGNAGKMREFKRILEPLGFQVTSMKEECIDVPIVEDGTTFAENARIKAMTVHQYTGEAVIADDSGICVDALGGRPGVYSARYGGEDLPHPEKIKLLLSELRDTPPEQRGARYECAIHFVLADGREYAFHADCPGMVGYETRGQNGFGYDPIFYIGERSFADFHSDLMHEMSVRCILRPAHEVNPKCKVIIKYPLWYENFHKNGYETVRQTRDFDLIWAGTETREPDAERWGRYPQTHDNSPKHTHLKCLYSAHAGNSTFQHIRGDDSVRKYFPRDLQYCTD